MGLGYGVCAVGLCRDWEFVWGNLIIALPLVFVVTMVGFGLWRRCEKPVVRVGESVPPIPPSTPSAGPPSIPGNKAQDFVTQAFSSPVPPPISESTEAQPSGPRYSKLVLWAFGFATLGWLLFFTGPIIGCVLGWVALKQIKKSETPLKGRGFAVFAALQAPVLLIAGMLGGGTFGLWEENLMPLPFPIAILALSALIFVLIRLVYKLMDIR